MFNKVESISEPEALTGRRTEGDSCGHSEVLVDEIEADGLIAVGIRTVNGTHGDDGAGKRTDVSSEDN